MAGTRGPANVLKNKQDKGGQSGSVLQDLLFDLVNALVPTGGQGGETAQPMTLQGADNQPALAKGNLGEALPGSPAMEKGPSLNYVFGENFPDRPAFSTVPPLPNSPPQRPGDPGASMEVPAQAPGFAPPMPAPNMEPNFREASQDMYTMQNTLGPGMPSPGPMPGPMGGGMQDPTALIAQALQPVQQPQVPPMPEQNPDRNAQFQDLMRQMLLSGGGFSG